MAIDLTQIEPTPENAAKYFPPLDIGPIWLKDDDGEWLLPEHTIGWEAIAWAESTLSAIRGEGMLQLTPEQMRVTLWFYAVDDEGDFTYQQAVYQAYKGAGKDPFGAVLAIIELIGPCRFSHWEYDEDGNKHPVAKDNPDGLVQLAGVSKAQTRNTMDMVPKLLSKTVRQEYKLDVQREIVYAYEGQRRMEMIGANPTALEGNRASFGVLNEIQHWVPSQGGQNLHNTIRDNVGKTPGNHYICITNAYQEGQGSVLEDIRIEQEKVWAGIAPDSGWLYMSREAHPEAPLEPEWVPLIMDTIIGDAWWQRGNMKALAKRVLDGSRPPSRTRRMYYNQVVSSEDKFFNAAEWGNALAEGCLGTELDLRPNDEIVLGFDGGKTGDATALVAIRVRDKLIVPILVEQRPEHWPKDQRWEVDRSLVNEEVHRVMDTFQVRAFFADTKLWESYIAMWSEEYGGVLQVRATATSAIGWDMSGSGSRERVSKMWELYRSSIIEGRLKHNGSGILRLHALNAHMGHNGKGLIARKDKPDSPRKIDVMVASYVAFAALSSLIEKGTTPKRPIRQRRGGPTGTMMRV